MRKYYVVIFLMFLNLGIFELISRPAIADPSLAKELMINQIKITGDEFLVLHNTTGTNMNLGNYWLQYFNDFNLSNQAISNSSQQLPAVILQPNQEILLAIGSAANCGQVWVSKLSFSFKDSAGLLQIVGINQTSGLVGYKVEDQVSWSSKTTDSVDIKGVSSGSPAQIWYRSAASWQSSASPIGCSSAGTTSASTGTPSILTRLNTSPPSIALGESTPGPANNLANSGLASPLISELLPNPGAPQTDATDEFIELYNPNNSAFDLSDYVLRTGTSTFHTYTFAPGQFILQPHEFRAFYSPQTGISLSNSASQAALVDPEGNVVAESSVYDTAKDDYAWVNSSGQWVWTTVATPNSQNVISAPALKKTTTAKVKSAAIKKTGKTSKTFSPKTTASGSAPFSAQPDGQSRLHPTVLAGVGLLALLYACYEYRHDIANQVYKLRRNRKIGQELRPAA